MRAPPSTRVLFAVGKLYPPRVCKPGRHYGRPLRIEVYDAAGGVWVQMADCSRCKSTVARSDFVRDRDR